MQNKIDLGNNYYLKDNEVYYVDQYHMTENRILNGQQVYAIKALFKRYSEKDSGQN